MHEHIIKTLKQSHPVKHAMAVSVKHVMIVYTPGHGGPKVDYVLVGCDVARRASAYMNLEHESFTHAMRVTSYTLYRSGQNKKPDNSDN